jgi:hypothetical protein
MTNYVPVTEFLGWKMTDNKELVLLGFKQPNGQEFTLGLAQDALDQAIIHLVNATAAFPSEKGLSAQTGFGMGVESLDVGNTPSTGQLFVRLRFPGGGHLLFNLDRNLAAFLREALGNELNIRAQGPPQGTPH